MSNTDIKNKKYQNIHKKMKNGKNIGGKAEDFMNTNLKGNIFYDMNVFERFLGFEVRNYQFTKSNSAKFTHSQSGDFRLSLNVIKQ